MMAWHCIFSEQPPLEELFFTGIEVFIPLMEGTFLSSEECDLVNSFLSISAYPKKQADTLFLIMYVTLHPSGSSH